MAPLVVKGKVLVGVAGGEFGVRGFVQAFDTQTGKSVWKTYTIPAPGEPGSDTWKKADTWKTGGASTWMTGNYDPDTNTVYWGTGNGSLWFGDQRPGDNLYTSSTVALNGDTGKIKWPFPVPSERVLGLGRNECANGGGLPKGRTTTKGLLKPARNGYLYWLKSSSWLLVPLLPAIRLFICSPARFTEKRCAVLPVAGDARRTTAYFCRHCAPARSPLLLKRARPILGLSSPLTAP
jgi:alcohol dehydrogenase (cytochrome c)